MPLQGLTCSTALAFSSRARVPAISTRRGGPLLTPMKSSPLAVWITKIHQEYFSSQARVPMRNVQVRPLTVNVCFVVGRFRADVGAGDLADDLELLHVEEMLVLEVAL